MQRRNAITVAATASLTLLAGAGGMMLSSGILGASADGGVGRIDPVPTAPSTLAHSTGATSTTVLPAMTAPATVVPATPPVTVVERPADATSAASAVRTEDRRDDEGREEHEYEGAEDDD